MPCGFVLVRKSRFTYIRIKIFMIDFIGNEGRRLVEKNLRADSGGRTFFTNGNG